jgi:hypothetical protein
MTLDRYHYTASTFVPSYNSSQHIHQNVMESLVHKESERQLKNLPPHLVKYIDPVDYPCMHGAKLVYSLLPRQLFLTRLKGSDQQIPILG